MTRPAGSPVVAALLLLTPALSIVVPVITPSTCLVFSAMGLYLLFKHRGEVLAQPWGSEAIRTTLLALVAFALLMFGENLLHGERWGVYHLAVAVTLFLPGFVLYTRSGASPRWLWAGAASGAIVAFVSAFVQVVAFNADRAGGAVNPIPFGNIALVLSVAALIGIGHVERGPGRRWWLALHIAGALCGVGASLLSGTKGSWPALLIVGFIAYRVLSEHLSRRRICGLGAAFSLALAGLIMLPQVSVLPRLEKTVNAFHSWKDTGEVADFSIGHRLAMWTFGARIAGERPLLGYGKDGMIQRKAQAIAEGYAPKSIAEYVTLHNEFLNMWVTKGLLGVVALLFVYGSAFRAFFQQRHSSHPEIRSVSLMGRTLIVLFLLFGFWEVTVQLNVYRNVFLFWILALVGLMSHLLREQAQAPQATAS
jgi:O-antigen ligase